MVGLTGSASILVCSVCTLQTNKRTATAVVRLGRRMKLVFQSQLRATLPSLWKFCNPAVCRVIFQSLRPKGLNRLQLGHHGAVEAPGARITGAWNNVEGTWEGLQETCALVSLPHIPHLPSGVPPAVATLSASSLSRHALPRRLASPPRLTASPRPPPPLNPPCPPSAAATPYDLRLPPQRRPAVASPVGRCLPRWVH